MVGMCSPPAFARPVCALRRAGDGKHAERLLSSLHSSASPSAADRLARKFVASSSKSAALRALSHLLSRSSPLALPLYRRIAETPWFEWNPKLAACVISLLEKHELAAEAQAMVSDSASRLATARELAHFYCDLIEAFSERGLKQRSFEFYSRIREIPCSGRRPYESMIKALCAMGFPIDAQKVFDGMLASGYKPSSFEYRLLIQGYGQTGLFSEMRRVVEAMEDSGFPMDTVCTNMVASCYGDHGELPEMAAWLQMMRRRGIPFSVRTFNSVLNACLTIVRMLRDTKSLPLSIEQLVAKLKRDSTDTAESLLVRELASSDVLVESLEWSHLEAKLDLHGFHLVSAYVILLQWLEELRTRLSKDSVVPLEVSVVCGSGKHSNTRGESPIKMLVSELMFRMDSPIRIDRKNVGRFVAKGKVVKDWLC